MTPAEATKHGHRTTEQVALACRISQRTARRRLLLDLLEGEVHRRGGKWYPGHGEPQWRVVAACSVALPATILGVAWALGVVLP